MTLYFIYPALVFCGLALAWSMYELAKFMVRSKRK